MGKVILTFGDIEIEKKKFTGRKVQIFWKVLVSGKMYLGE